MPDYLFVDEPLFVARSKEHQRLVVCMAIAALTVSIVIATVKLPAPSGFSRAGRMAGLPAEWHKICNTLPQCIRDMTTMFGKLKEAGSIAWETLRTFSEDDPFQLAAALSYYTLLSLAPLLLVIVGAAGLLLGEEQVRQALVEQIRQLVGNEGASLLQTVMQNAGKSPSNVVSMIVGFSLMLLGATTIFAQLQAALNRIWGVKASPSNAVLGFARARLLSLSVVLGLAFLMLVSLVLSAAISGLQDYLAGLFPGAAVLSTILNNLLSLALIALVLAMLFRYVPDVEITWHDTFFGALVTALLLTVGKYALGVYLGHAAVGSAYGAAASAVVFMVWVYYTSVILFLGAKSTRVIARHHGSPLQPSPHAKPIAGDAPRTEQEGAMTH